MSSSPHLFVDPSNHVRPHFVVQEQLQLTPRHRGVEIGTDEKSVFSGGHFALGGSTTRHESSGHLQEEEEENWRSV